MQRIPVSTKNNLCFAGSAGCNLSPDSKVGEPVRKPHNSCVLFTMSDDEGYLILTLAYKFAFCLQRPINACQTQMEKGTHFIRREDNTLD